MATIYSSIALPLSISANMQSSAINSQIVISPSVTATLSSTAISGSISISLSYLEDRPWPFSGQQSSWELNAEQFVYAPGLSLSLPILTFQGSGRLEPRGFLSLALPALRFSGTIPDTFTGSLAFSLPALKSLFSSRVNETGTLTLSIPALRFLGKTERGAIGTLNLTLPMLRLSTSSLLSAEGTLSIIIPMIKLGLLSLPDSYSAMVMNIKNNALTLYSNYNFNSFCRFNGINLGATKTGIFNLDSGDTDNGDQIAWNFRTPYLDLSQKVKKRITQAWFSYKSDGDIIVSIIQPNGEFYEYSLDGIDITESEGRAVFGKGIKSKYVALDVKNVEGSNITLDTMKLQFMKTTKER